ncbi:MAG: adenosylcobinamide-GDP ribazoletransferase, partial [Eubacteriales bacterium]
PFLLIPAFSRAVTGTALVFGKSARRGGIAYTFAEAGDLPAVRAVMICWDTAIPVLVGIIDPWNGVAFALLAAMGGFFFMKDTAKQFGGITGDLCGCLIMQLGLLLLIGCRIVLR